MNKIEFLKELQGRISLLEDDEQRDIIDEYSQHIDTKVQKGMTEAEAIEDFGPIDQLVEELLSAYHVKASAVEKTEQLDANSVVAGGKQAVTAAADATKRGCSKLRAEAAKAYAKAVEKAEAAKVHAEANGNAGQPAANAADAAYDAPNVGAAATDPARQRSHRAESVAHGIVKGGSSLWSGCVGIVKTCARWLWNFCVACAGLATLLCALCGIFAFGFCLLLILQGYPLVGITVIALGATVSLACLTLLLAQLILLKKKPEEAAAAKNAGDGEPPLDNQFCGNDGSSRNGQAANGSGKPLEASSDQPSNPTFPQASAQPENESPACPARPFAPEGRTEPIITVSPTQPMKPLSSAKGEVM